MSLDHGQAPGPSREKYLQDYKETVIPYSEKAFAYERLAIEYSSAALRTLSLLNGGALVAIPTAVALFKTDPQKSSFFLVCAGLLFVAGLIFVSIALGAGFFTMARRSESLEKVARYQSLRTNTNYYPPSDEKVLKAKFTEADDAENESKTKMQRSNYWRFLGIGTYWLSLASFIAGCWFGARAVLS